ncbi:unnamed protein product [Protopolystoma xenopodis]|uniref:Ubiquitin-conjugating enzyme E2 Z n=1 Tax=Protopolystoma xenopodis TaxID=117903 RepID=A0A448XI03_9PLAT|nr:unnamed protein product [Protopolystoma xenopodis]
MSDPAPGICVVPDNDDMTKIYALVTGPFDTPYEGGFFVFLIGCPPKYPLKPPKVKLMTTGNNNVRFGPNFYKNGKVSYFLLEFLQLYLRISEFECTLAIVSWTHCFGRNF